MLKRLHRALKDENKCLLGGFCMAVGIGLSLGWLPEVIARWPWTAAVVIAYVAVMTALISKASSADDEEDGR